MAGQVTSQQHFLAGAEDFKHFLWRRHRRTDALDGFVPEVLATDGRVVRRMSVDARQLTFQQFEDQRTAECIVNSVESNSSSAVGMLGYSMFSNAEALAILHSGGDLDAGWLAFPCPVGSGRPAAIPTMPIRLDDIPTLRLCGGAQVRWRDCNLVFEAAVEQRDSGVDERVDLLDHLIGWQVRTTVSRDGIARPSRLVADKQALDGIRRTGGGRAEASFRLDAAAYQRLDSPGDVRAWFVLEFDRRLFCLPPGWCTWWFELRFPPRISS